MVNITIICEFTVFRGFGYLVNRCEVTSNLHPVTRTKKLYIFIF